MAIGERADGRNSAGETWRLIQSFLGVSAAISDAMMRIAGVFDGEGEATLPADAFLAGLVADSLSFADLFLVFGVVVISAVVCFFQTS